MATWISGQPFKALALQPAGEPSAVEHIAEKSAISPLQDRVAEPSHVVDIPGNWHRVLDARRARRPEIQRRPVDNPLHRIAAAVATLGEAADAFADFARREQWPEWAAPRYRPAPP
jgi:hypothetical protein